MRKKQAILFITAVLLFSMAANAFSQTGILDLDSQPTGAYVYINGTRVGKTPLYDPLIPVGEYIVRIQAEGFRAYSEKVSINDIDVLKRAITLERTSLGKLYIEDTLPGEEAEKGNYVIASIPKGGEIFIEGKKIDKLAPIIKKNIDVGFYQVIARMDGKYLSGTLLIESGKTAKIIFNFDKRIVLDGTRIEQGEKAQGTEGLLKEISPSVEEVEGGKNAKSAQDMIKKVRARELALKRQSRETAEKKARAMAVKDIENVKARADKERKEELALSQKTREMAKKVAEEMAARDLRRAEEIKMREKEERLKQEKLLKEEAERIEQEKLAILDREKNRLAESVKEKIIPDMVIIPGGRFYMGSNIEMPNTKPMNSVRVQSFAISKYEVTQSQWRELMGTSPWSGYRKDCPDCPATNIASFEKEKWSAVQDFLRRASELTGRTLRLPTEAEWEYAAGNGALHTRYSWGNNLPEENRGGNVADIALLNNQYPVINMRIFENYEDGYPLLAPVGSFAPNNFGLHDMTGNVWELASNWYDTDGELVQRGGGSGSSPEEALITIRRFGVHAMEIGFRIACDVE